MGPRAPRRASSCRQAAISGQQTIQKLYDEDGRLIKVNFYRGGKIVGTREYSPDMRGRIPDVDRCMFDMYRAGWQPEKDYVPGEIIVCSAKEVKQEEAMAILKSHGIKEEDVTFSPLVIDPKDADLITDQDYTCLLAKVKVPLESEIEWTCKLRAEEGKKKIIINQLHTTDGEILVPCLREH
jgi:hypothetical protein